MNLKGGGSYLSLIDQYRNNAEWVSICWKAQSSKPVAKTIDRGGGEKSRDMLLSSRAACGPLVQSAEADCVLAPRASQRDGFIYDPQR